MDAGGGMNEPQAIPTHCAWLICEEPVRYVLTWHDLTREPLREVHTAVCAKHLELSRFHGSYEREEEVVTNADL